MKEGRAEARPYRSKGEEGTIGPRGLRLDALVLVYS